MTKSPGAGSQILRRVPLQQRSRDRLTLILDTAADVLSTHGPAGTSITAVAARAGLPASSVYDYVAAERELIAAVAERGLQQVHDDFVAILGEPDTVDELARALSVALTMFLRRYKSNPGFKEALAFIDADPQLMQINLADTRRNAALIAHAVTAVLPNAHVDVAALLITHLSGSLADLAARVSEAESKLLVEQYEQLIAIALDLQ